MHYQLWLGIGVPLAISLICGPARSQQVTVAPQVERADNPHDGCLTWQQALASGLSGIAVQLAKADIKPHDCVNLPKLIGIVIVEQARRQQLMMASGH